MAQVISIVDSRFLRLGHQEDERRRKNNDYPRNWRKPVMFFLKLTSFHCHYETSIAERFEKQFFSIRKSDFYG